MFLLNIKKIKSEYSRQVEEDGPTLEEEQPQLELAADNTDNDIDHKPNEEDTICEIETILLEVAENYNQKVILSGNEYPAYDLFRMIVDYPCRIKWSRANGIKIERGNYEDWGWFKEANLKPNTKQIKDIVKQANKLILQQVKEFEQRAKRN